MKNDFVVTIGRQYGSGGRIIGELLAKRLGVAFYDNELISLAADKTGLSVDCFKNAEQTSAGNLLLSMTTLSPMIDTYGLPLHEKIFMVQSQVIKEVAEKESCVIVGRCADHSLSEHPNCITVFLQGDIKDRVKRAVCSYGLPEKNAQSVVLKTDKKRGGYYNYFTGEKWGYAQNYDIILNTSHMELEKIVEILAQYVSFRAE